MFSCITTDNHLVLVNPKVITDNPLPEPATIKQLKAAFKLREPASMTAEFTPRVRAEGHPNLPAKLLLEFTELVPTGAGLDAISREGTERGSPDQAYPETKSTLTADWDRALSPSRAARFSVCTSFLTRFWRWLSKVQGTSCASGYSSLSVCASPG